MLRKTVLSLALAWAVPRTPSQSVARRQARLKELYPEDKATGFSVGAIRGAITIRKPL